MEQARTRITCRDHHHNASSGLSFNGRLQCVDRATFRNRAAPGVNCNVRCFRRVALPAAHRGRRQEKFHALDVSGWRAHALVHVTAGNPLCARRHPDLVGTAIGADRCACGVAAVEEIIARHGELLPANAASASWMLVMPIEVVIGRDAIPAAVMRLECVMRPPNTGIGAANDDILSSEAFRPDGRRVRVS